MVTCNGVLYDGAIVIQNDRIFDVVKSRDDIPADAEIIDAKGAYVGPGFVDIHVLGCGSIDTYDASAAAVDHFLRHGIVDDKFNVLNVMSEGVLYE